MADQAKNPTTASTNSKNTKPPKSSGNSGQGKGLGKSGR